MVQSHTIRAATSIYRVRKGDTLYSIAWRFGQHYETLARRNAIIPPYTIFPGQTLLTRDRLNRHNKRRMKTTHRRKSVAKPLPNKPLLRGPRQSSVRARQGQTKITAYAKPGRRNWRWPVRGVVIKTYTKQGHSGIKIKASPWVKVHATAAGRVVYSGSGLKAYGKLIIVKHNSRFLSAYGFNKEIFVKEGDAVERGQAIARLGEAAVLHFELRKFGKPVDPLGLLPRR